MKRPLAISNSTSSDESALVIVGESANGDSTRNGAVLCPATSTTLLTGKIATHCEFDEAQLGDIAKACGDVEQAYGELRIQARRSLKKARALGERLIRVSELCKHGEWGEVLTCLCEAFGFSERSANLYMAISRDWTKLCKVGDERLSSMTLADVQRYLATRSRTNRPKKTGMNNDDAHVATRKSTNEEVLPEDIAGSMTDLPSAPVIEADDYKIMAESAVAPKTLLAQTSGVDAKCASGGAPACERTQVFEADANPLPAVVGKQNDTLLFRHPKLLSIANRLRELEERFSTIVVDPWGMLNGCRADFSRLEISRLPVARVAAADSHLYIVAPHDRIVDAAVLLETWGFAAVTSLVVVGPKCGTDGPCWSPRHYVVLVGVSGKLPFRALELSSWLEGNGNGFHIEQVKVRIRDASPSPTLHVFGTNDCKESGWCVLA